ncbi:Xaa-Pro aminopeptidase P [Spatholobus suberectus]|nr:Xaa-Pro aminopeptidase P [Spatholobus suberectus]
MEDTLSALRSLMASHSPPLDALVVPSEDYHQSEYVSARDKRREFVSDFTGSAGRSVADKLKDLRKKLVQEQARGIIFTALDEVAWLYNIRGSDVAYCPVVHAFAIVTSNSASFMWTSERFLLSQVALAETEARKIPSETDKSVNGEHQAEENSNDLIWADPELSELDGLRRAHIRDGAAVVQYLVWLDKKMQDIYGASGYFLEKDSVKKEKHLQSLKLTEVTVSDQLEGFRASKEHFRGLSFPTISSVGPNAAIIHYSPKAETCAELDPDKIYLFDSGAQVCLIFNSLQHRHL